MAILHHAKCERRSMLITSARPLGYRSTCGYGQLNETLGLMRNDPRFGQWEYWITIMGEPSRAEPWGWQLDGHHCVMNYFVLGDQVVMTPTFMGSEPVRAETGPFTGTVVLQKEQNMGLQLFTSLRPDQRAKATLKKDKRPVESLAAAFRDNVVMDYAGIPVSNLTAAQRGQLLKIIEEYVGNVKERHANIRMDEVHSQLLEDT